KKVMTFIPWDKSNTFWENANYSIFRNIRTAPENKRNKLVLRALRYTDLTNAYLDGLLEAATSAEESSAATAGQTAKRGLSAQADGGPGWLERLATRYYELIRTDARADPVKPFTNDEFEASVDVVKTFARERSKAIRDQVAAERP